MTSTNRNVQLNVFCNHTQEQVIRIKTPAELTIGTDAQADIHIDDANISVIHCLLQIDENQQCCLSDLNSTNEARLNGLRIEGTKRLFSGDLIQLGCITILFMLVSERRHKLAHASQSNRSNQEIPEWTRGRSRSTALTAFSD